MSMEDEMEEDDVPFSADQIDDALEETYSELFKANNEIIRKSRRVAKRIEEIQRMYLDQANRCEEVIQMHIAGAAVVSQTIGDLLSTEWGIEDTDNEDDDEEFLDD